MSQYRIISICQRTINIINCAQDGASLITRQGAVKKKNAHLFQHQGHTNKIDSTYLENYIGIYAHAVSLRIQSKCEKIRTRKTLNTDICHAVHLKLFHVLINPFVAAGFFL